MSLSCCGTAHNQLLRQSTIRIASVVVVSASIPLTQDNLTTMRQKQQPAHAGGGFKTKPQTKEQKKKRKKENIPKEQDKFMPW